MKSNLTGSLTAGGSTFTHPAPLETGSLKSRVVRFFNSGAALKLACAIGYTTLIIAFVASALFCAFNALLLAYAAGAPLFMGTASIVCLTLLGKSILWGVGCTTFSALTIPSFAAAVGLFNTSKQAYKNH